MNPGEGKAVVCVTGGSGYIGSYLVSQLLRRGYTVRASVRNLNDPEKTSHLRALEGAEDRLCLFEAELLKDGSFDSAINGCQGVFHTASPCFLPSEDPQAQLVDPAVKGTLNVLSSCAKNPSLRRVVLTSSMAAVLMNDRPITPEVTVDESWFSDPECRPNRKTWYGLSKTLAEDLAWKFAREKGIDLVAINPARVIGPLLQPKLNSSCSHVLNMVNGSKTYDNASPGWVHINDVVEAHIRAFETPSANGRYCLAERVAHCSEIVGILKELYPDLQLPEKCANDEPAAPVFKVAKEKVKSLGIDYVPIEVGLKDTVESFKEKGFVSF